MTEPNSSAPSEATGIPSAVPFDPGARALPSEFAAPDATPGPVVLLASATYDLEWAADAAVALAAAWGNAGRRVVLADLHVEDPLLHERLGQPNLDGIVDVFLYGASLARSARPVRGRGFYLISAGTYAADKDAVYHHPRWAKLVAGFRDAQATLVLFAPPERGALAALADWADEAIVLGQGAIATPDVVSVLGSTPVRAVFVPPHVVPAPEPTAPSVTPPRDSPAALTNPVTPAAHRVAAEIAAPPEEREYPYSPLTPAGFQRRTVNGEGEGTAAVDAVPSSAPLPPAVLEEEMPVELPPPPARSRRARRGRGLSPVVWVVALLALLAAAALLFTDLPLRIGGERGAPVPATVLAPAPPPAAAELLAVPLPYSIRLKGFTTLDAAQAEIADIRRNGNLDDVPLYLSPALNQGIVYHYVMAGALPDSAAAAALRARLAAAELFDEQDPIGGLVNTPLYVPLAYQLGDFETQEEAATQADSLLQRDFASYALPLPYSDGSTRFRLYAGAYEDSIAAAPLRERLAQSQLSLPLVARVGAPPEETAAAAIPAAPEAAAPQ